MEIVFTQTEVKKETAIFLTVAGSAVRKYSARHKVICVVCQDTFFCRLRVGRFAAKYCSNSCRCKAYRKRVKEKNAKRWAEKRARRDQAQQMSQHSGAVASQMGAKAGKAGKGSKKLFGGKVNVAKISKKEEKRR